jgi:LmbE family N-acetylglucosaminyl deacetylase
MNPVVFVSPHFDDVALSCGELICKFKAQGKEILVVTVFSGSVKPELLSTTAKFFHKICGLGNNAMEIRKAEDLAAMKMLKVAYLHVDELECLYRMNDSHTPRYNDLKEIFGARLENEMDTWQHLKKQLREKLAEINFRTIFIPLSLGRHIDHILTRSCLEEIYSDRDIYYYEDTPYVCTLKDMDEINQATGGLIPTIIEITDDEWLGKVNAINCYTSQSGILWGSETEKMNQLESISKKYDNRGRSIRIWGKKNLVLAPR